MAEPGFEDAIPVRQHDFEEHPDRSVTVRVPKFTGPFARRFVLPLLAKPEIRVHLDEVGSTVWLACDGRTNVGRLTDLVGERLGLTQDAARERVQSFLRQLAREGSLTFQVPADEAGSP